MNEACATKGPTQERRHAANFTLKCATETWKYYLSVLIELIRTYYRELGGIGQFKAYANYKKSWDFEFKFEISKAHVRCNKSWVWVWAFGASRRIKVRYMYNRKKLTLNMGILFRQESLMLKIVKVQAMDKTRARKCNTRIACPFTRRNTVNSTNGILNDVEWNGGYFSRQHRN